MGSSRAIVSNLDLTPWSPSGGTLRQTSETINWGRIKIGTSPRRVELSKCQKHFAALKSHCYMKRWENISRRWGFICTEPLLRDHPTKRFLLVATSMHRQLNLLVETIFIGLIFVPESVVPDQVLFLSWIRFNFFSNQHKTLQASPGFLLFAVSCLPGHPDPILMIVEQQP